MIIKYNAPAILSFAFFSVAVMAVTNFFWPTLVMEWFAAPARGQFSATDARSWVSLFSHISGHADWTHLFSNFAIILLVGPMLEEIYGSPVMLVMILATAAATGVLNALFFPSPMIGASSVAFMLILLASFTNFSKGEIPLTFILILAMYLGIEIVRSFGPGSGVAHFAHIAGGFCGSLFGFFFQPKKPKQRY
ncbi:MAG: rhomboid family intramembrane serine protease [Treponema sp.]|nr:rhomboid family intramembrane serine protease [Treponema sp.]